MGNVSSQEMFYNNIVCANTAIFSPNVRRLLLPGNITINYIIGIHKTKDKIHVFYLFLTLNGMNVCLALADLESTVDVNFDCY